MASERLTPYLRRKVLDLPLADKVALYRDLSKSIHIPEEKASKRMAVLRDRMLEQTGIDVLRRTRLAEVVEARTVFVCVCQLEGYAQTQIARFLGKDHSTVCHAYKTMRNAFDYPQQYPTLIDLYNNFTKAII